MFRPLANDEPDDPSNHDNQNDKSGNKQCAEFDNGLCQLGRNEQGVGRDRLAKSIRGA